MEHGIRHQPESFEPVGWARGGHLQTLAAHLLGRPRPLPDAQARQVSLADGDRLLLQLADPAAPRPDRRTALLIHGLGGSSTASYMLRIGARFLAAGWRVALMNLRGAGAGAALARKLYNAGRSPDLAAAVQTLAGERPDAPLLIVGFSLGGNILLKYLGEPQHAKPDCLMGSIAICPPIDLAACATAISRPRNFVYDLRFVTMLRLELRGRDLPIQPRSRSLLRPLTLLGFDDLVTAPAGGFASGAEYYARSSARGFLPAIDTPTVLLAADDDPFIPVASYRDLPANDSLLVEVTRGGGHMGYLSRRRTPLGDRRWMDYAIITYAEGFLAAGAA